MKKTKKQKNRRGAKRKESERDKIKLNWDKYVIWNKIVWIVFSSLLFLLSNEIISFFPNNYLNVCLLFVNLEKVYFDFC